MKESLFKRIKGKRRLNTTKENTMVILLILWDQELFFWILCDEIISPTMFSLLRQFKLLFVSKTKRRKGTKEKKEHIKEVDFISLLHWSLKNNIASKSYNYNAGKYAICNSYTTKLVHKKCRLRDFLITSIISYFFVRRDYSIIIT